MIIKRISKVCTVKMKEINAPIEISFRAVEHYGRRRNKKMVFNVERNGIFI